MAPSLWLVVVGAAALVCAAHWTELSEDFSDRVLAPQNLLLLWLMFPVLKLLHEFGHACATKAWGGEVHEMGIMLLVLMPIPYVDATAATAFRETRRRVVVGAAGMIVELFIASIALFLWLEVRARRVHAPMLYNVMLIAGISTVLFNANPLLRYDGYYILCGPDRRFPTCATARTSTSATWSRPGSSACSCRRVRGEPRGARAGSCSSPSRRSSTASSSCWRSRCSSPAST